MKLVETSVVFKTSYVFPDEYTDAEIEKLINTQFVNEFIQSETTEIITGSVHVDAVTLCEMYREQQAYTKWDDATIIKNCFNNHLKEESC